MLLALSPICLVPTPFSLGGYVALIFPLFTWSIEVRGKTVPILVLNVTRHLTM